MKVARFADVSTLAVAALGVTVPPSNGAVVNRACPSGSTASDTRSLEGELRSKTCFKGPGDWFYWKDINTDGIGAYAYATFYQPGVDAQKYLRSDNYSGTATDTYFDGAVVNIDENRALRIWACSENASSGVDYGCGTGTAVAAGDR